MTNRHEVFSAISDERVYQDRKWGTLEEHPHEVGSWLTIIRKLHDDAERAYMSQRGDQGALDEMRKVVAVGVACMEQHGVVQRQPVDFAAQSENFTEHKAEPGSKTTISLSRPVLMDGEHYAGIILGKDGKPDYHLILLPGEVESITWTKAKEWAEKSGGELPNRREQALLYANLKDQFKPAWYWSGEHRAPDSIYAWFQLFDYGNQYDGLKSAELRARAVRRLEFL